LQTAAEARKQLKHQEGLGSPVKSAPDQDQRHANPGYSSGGSSDLDSSEKAKSGELDEEIGPTNSESRHSDILTNLKQEIVKDNGLTTKVVRLEVGRLKDSQRRH
jgi:hypothetical protein